MTAKGDRVDKPVHINQKNNKSKEKRAIYFVCDLKHNFPIKQKPNNPGAGVVGLFGTIRPLSAPSSIP